MTLTAVPLSQRVDARSKATGTAAYTADVPLEGALHAVVVRSPLPHAEIRGVSTAEATAVGGVVGVYTAEDLPTGLSGRRVCDMPPLARSKVRFTGENVAVVVAETLAAAEMAAALVEVDYAEMPAVLNASDAIAPGAPQVHDAAWSYDGAVVGPDDPANLQSELTEGSPGDVDRALAGAMYVVERTYRTPAGHQGYLEPQAWIAVPSPGGRVRLRGTTKSPYRLREQVAKCLQVDLSDVEVEPTMIGGDFGGKGGVGDACLCAALALRTGRAVRMVFRSGEDLTSTDARHPALLHVRVGCDGAGALLALSVDALFDGGAYAAAKPVSSVNLHGMAECALGYRLGHYAVRSRVVYTNTVPKGHMRAPGAPQAVFAIESAIDELAAEAGIDPVDLRMRNVLRDGDRDAYGHLWAQARGAETLAAALRPEPAFTAPAGWDLGTGVAVYARPTAAPAATSLRLVIGHDGRMTVEVPIPETGTGSHSVVRQRLSEALGVDPEMIDVVQAPTSTLSSDPGVGGSRVTVRMAAAVDRLVEEWRSAGGEGPVTVEATDGGDEPALSFCAQVARVAVDPATGQVRVLEIVTAVDVATIVRPRSHQIQVDGGTLMGFGFACLEDLLEAEGQVWASNLGEFKLPSPADSPTLRTVLVEGGMGVGPANLKSIGELTNVAVAPAIASAVASATGCRVRELPITAERVYLSAHHEERE